MRVSRAVSTLGYIVMVPVRFAALIPLAVVLMLGWALCGWSTRERTWWYCGGIVTSRDQVNSLAAWTGWRFSGTDMNSVVLLRIRAWPMTSRWRKQLPWGHRLRLRQGDA